MSIPQPQPLSPPGALHRERLAASLGLAALAALTPIVRTLMVTDGTVTEVLAAYYGEEVGVTVLEQAYGATEGDHPELAVPAGTRVLDRSIVLTGASTGTSYAAAWSRLVPDRLPPGMQEGLLAGKAPLGKLMLDQRLESFKEVVDCGRSATRPVPERARAGLAALGPDPAEPVAWRTYRVISGGRPLMIITELFPEALH